MVSREEDPRDRLGQGAGRHIVEGGREGGSHLVVVLQVFLLQALYRL